MDITLEPNRYVVAVSGGVDSVVLLNVLSMHADVELIVAHYDHGIRGNSAEDAEFVRGLAMSYGLPFELGNGALGPNASEALARAKRYEFLEKVSKKHDASAIITAHHQDDVLETALINVLRGTGRKGLSSLQSGGVVRPLLNKTKKELLDYAHDNKLKWREDPTNQDTRYTRNKLRSLLSDADPTIKAELSELLSGHAGKNKEADSLLEELVGKGVTTIDRGFFISLPYDVSCELVAHWLRGNGREFDRRSIARLVRAMKVAGNNTQHDVDKNYVVVVQNKQISLQPISSV